VGVLERPGFGTGTKRCDGAMAGVFKGLLSKIERGRGQRGRHHAVEGGGGRSRPAGAGGQRGSTRHAQTAARAADRRALPINGREAVTAWGPLISGARGLTGGSGFK
jgi:hypothetical protein